MGRKRVFGQETINTEGSRFVIVAQHTSPGEMFRELIEITRLNDSMRQASSPFGKFIYDKEDRGFVADALIRLAAQIRTEQMP